MDRQLTKHFKPYVEAVKKILTGEYVDNLEQIRENCNLDFLKDRELTEDNVGKYMTEAYFNPSLTVMTFAADAENQILQGKNPHEVYKTIQSDSNIEELRDRCRKILERIIEKNS